MIYLAIIIFSAVALYALFTLFVVYRAKKLKKKALKNRSMLYLESVKIKYPGLMETVQKHFSGNPFITSKDARKLIKTNKVHCSVSMVKKTFLCLKNISKI